PAVFRFESDAYLIGAGWDTPPPGALVERRKQARGDRGGDLPVFARLEGDATPADKAQNVRAARSSEIELWNRRSGAITRIPHCGLGRDRVAADLAAELAHRD